jgi:hypothetical protein
MPLLSETLARGRERALPDAWELFDCKGAGAIFVMPLLSETLARGRERALPDACELFDRWSAGAMFVIPRISKGNRGLVA